MKISILIYFFMNVKSYNILLIVEMFYVFIRFQSFDCKSGNFSDSYFLQSSVVIFDIFYTPNILKFQ